MKKWIYLALLFAPALYAQTPADPCDNEPACRDLTWQHPTQNTDDTPIPTTGDTALSSSTLAHSLCDDGSVGDNPSYVVVQQPDNTAAIRNLPVGENCFTVAATNRAGLTSDPSNTAESTVSDSVPEPPGDLEVGTDTRVFEIVQPENELRLSESGTVASGTACDTRYSVTGAHQIAGQPVEFLTVYMVPVSAVQWFGRERTIALSTCQ